MLYQKEKIHWKRGLVRMCNGKLKHGKGFIWKYAEGGSN
jgi:hypothetical protein